MKKNLQIGKKIALALMLLVTATVVNAANRYAVATNNWNATATWSSSDGGAPGASVPVAGDVVYIGRNYSVTIPAGVTAQCTTLNITYGSGGGVTAATGTLIFAASTSALNVSGNMTVGISGSSSREGVVDMSAGGVLTVGGNITIGNNGASAPVASEINQGANSSVTVTGNVSIIAPGNNNYANRWQVNNGTASVSGTLTLATTGNDARDCNVIISTGTLSVTGAITMNGSAARNSMSITGAGTLNIGNSISTTNGTFSLSATSTVHYNGAAQTLRAATYQNLTFSGSAAKTIAAATTVNGKLSRQGTATVAGTAPAYGANAVLEYKGSAAQTTSNVEFPNTVNVDLIIDNAAGVTLNAAKTLTGTMTLANGDLATTNTNLLTISGAWTGGGGSASSHVSGPLAKVGSTAFTFPVGNGTLYRPISIESLSASATVRATYFLANPRTGIGTTLASGLYNVSLCEYWDLDDGGSTITGKVGLQFSSASPCNANGYVTDPATLVVAHWSGTQWDNLGSDGSATMTNVKANSNSAFSPFTIGSTSNLNPLPVSFTNLKAFEKANGVQIEWTNATESDMSAYVIERSANGIDFNAIGQTAPRSNQSDQVSYTYFDAAPLAGTSFYRVKAIEISGKNVYTKSLRVDIDRSSQGISLYPNPVRGSEITIGFSALKGQYSLSVLNTAGQVVYRQQLNHAGGTAAQSVALPASLKTGVYNVLISGDNYKETKMFVIQ